MSGDGVISARLPRSLLEALKNTAERNHLSSSDIAGRILSRANSLSEVLSSIEDPTTAGDSQRVSFYVGWDCVEMLFQQAAANHMRLSTLVRRVLYAVLITKAVEFVQENGSWKLQLVSQIAHREHSQSGASHAAR